jgi:hypothetical protein
MPRRWFLMAAADAADAAADYAATPVSPIFAIIFHAFR